MQPSSGSVPLAGFQTLLGLGAVHQPSTYHQIIHPNKPLAEQNG